MSDRVELRTDISSPGGVRGVRKSGGSRDEDGGRKFAVELDRRLHHHEEKERPEEEGDKIIIQQDKEDANDDGPRDQPKHEHDKQAPPEEGKGIKIDYVA